jgi:hypothetical protein
MRKVFNRRVVIGAVIGLALGWLAGGQYTRAQSRTAPLNGTWTVTVSPDEQARAGGDKEYVDTVTVKLDDTFSSETLKKKGFKDEKVQIDTRPFAPAQFDVTLKNEKTGESAKYHGVADGQQLTGTLVMTTKGGDAKNYTLKGEPKKK